MGQDMFGFLKKSKVITPGDVIHRPPGFLILYSPVSDTGFARILSYGAETEQEFSELQEVFFTWYRGKK